jgi:hypothetical protein
MQMVDGLCDQRFLYILVTSRGQVDALVVPGFLFVENFCDKKHDCMAEILFAQTVLFSGNHHSINRVWIELVQNLLPGSFVLS